jgi:hypothetical protein
MALTSDELTYLRQLISEPSEDNGWTDERIAELGPGALQQDGSYDLRLYAAVLWEAKAAEAVTLVDTGESGSSRAMGQVFTHAKQMAERYRAPAGGPGTPDPLSGRPRSTKIVRATRG